MTKMAINTGQLLTHFLNAHSGPACEPSRRADKDSSSFHHPQRE